MKIVEEHFSSIHQLLSVISSRPKNSEMATCDSSESNGENFTGTKNFEEAVDLFQYGYTDVLDKIKSGIASNVKCHSVEQRRYVKNGVAGYAPNVPNAIQGLPNSMIYTEKQLQKVKVITIYYSMCENCSCPKEEMIKSGITMLSAVNILEKSGIRTKLEVVFFCAAHDGNTEGTFATVRVKDFREYMDIQKLCFPIVHPSMFRRFGFKWLETTPYLHESGWKYGYGHVSGKVIELARKMLNDNEIIITLQDTKNAHYDPEELIKNLNIKK